ncbi:hypothetical protein [Streptomyces sp. NPDC057545]|uniref:hypothetical protein n=1 Tax=unclassified Streptomyces TaxID=2593676 RepID=UPI0036B0E1B0
MASIRKRERKDGSTIYQVRWLQGSRGGRWETESFADEDSAAQFKKLVDAHGQQWPHGWVKGQGFVEETPIPGDVPFETWATRYIDRLTGIDERTREDYHRDLRIHLSLLRHTDAAGREYPATIGNLTQDDIADWVRAEERGEPTPGCDGRPTRRALRIGMGCSSASCRPPSTPRPSFAPRTAAKRPGSPESTTTPQKR